MRRTFASVLNDLGLQQADVKALMNHKSKDITEIYIQNNIETLRKHMVRVVQFYDRQVKFPENIKAGFEDSVANMLQASLYGNIDASPDPLERPEYDEEKQKEMEREYWLGSDAA
jgi:hypothetical protein